MQAIFSLKGILHTDQWKTVPAKQFLSRQLRLPEHRTLLMSATGYESLRSIVSILHESDCFEGHAEFSDIWSACRELIEECLAKNKMPENGGEMVSLVQAKVEVEIDEFTFVVPLYGVKLEMEAFPIGTMIIVPATEEWLSANARRTTDELVPGIARSMEAPCWLVGSVKGTYRAAERKFELLARLVAGLIGVLAAATHEGGAEGFRIRAVMAPEDGTRPASTVAVWGKHGRQLSFARRMAVGQPYVLDEDLKRKMDEADSVIGDAFEILQRDARNEVEGAIVKAVFWYADAHRDPIEVMRFVKFWSCIETFFPAPKETTKNVTLGATAVLVYGPLGSVPRAEYQETKSRLVSLYGDRSRAVHHAKHDHVTSRDVADLSQWAAWVILNVVAMSKSGLSQCSKLLEECQRLDNLES